MFRPRDSFDQRLLESNLVVVPTPVGIRWLHDTFGNCITLVEFDAPTTSLSFETRLRIDHHPEDTPDFSIEDHAMNHPFDYVEEELPDLAPYMRRHHAEEEDRVEQWLGTFVDMKASQPTGQLLMTLNEAIRDGFAYSRRTVLGTRTPGETIARREGTCRDFALLMMEAARQLGFAARFVTGYVYVPDRDQTSRLGVARRTRGAKSIFPVRVGPNSIRPTVSSAIAISYRLEWPARRGKLRRCLDRTTEARMTRSAWR